MEIGHEIIFTVILSQLLIQVGQLSVTGERMYTYLLVSRLGLSLPWKSVVRLTDHLNMTIVVDWDVKPQNKLVNNVRFHVSTPQTTIITIMCESTRCDVLSSFIAP